MGRAVKRITHRFNGGPPFAQITVSHTLLMTAKRVRVGERRERDSLVALPSTMRCPRKPQEACVIGIEVGTVSR